MISYHQIRKLLLQHKKTHHPRHIVDLFPSSSIKTKNANLPLCFCGVPDKKSYIARHFFNECCTSVYSREIGAFQPPTFDGGRKTLLYGSPLSMNSFQMLWFFTKLSEYHFPNSGKKRSNSLNRSISMKVMNPHWHFGVSTDSRSQLKDTGNPSAFSVSPWLQNSFMMQTAHRSVTLHPFAQLLISAQCIMNDANKLLSSEVNLPPKSIPLSTSSWQIPHSFASMPFSVRTSFNVAKNLP